eukprot:jgi/Bigna1/72805/fgenesh1_pg.21_\
MFDSLRKNFGLVCGGKRDKSLGNRGGAKPKLGELYGTGKFNSERNPTDMQQRPQNKFDVLYEDMRNDMKQIEDAGVTPFGHLDRVGAEVHTNKETGVMFFYNTITGECKGPGAPKNGIKHQNIKKVHPPPHTAFRMGTTLDPILESSSSSRGGTSHLAKMLRDNRDYAKDDSDDDDTKYRSAFPSAAGSGITNTPRNGPQLGEILPSPNLLSKSLEEEKRRGGKSAQEEDDGLDFFSAFASGVTGDTETAKKLVTKGKIARVTKSAREKEHTNALDSLFTVNADAPNVIQPAWHGEGAAAASSAIDGLGGRLGLALSALEEIDEEESYSGPINQPPSILRGCGLKRKARGGPGSDKGGQ